MLYGVVRKLATKINIFVHTHNYLAKFSSLASICTPSSTIIAAVLPIIRKIVVTLHVSKYRIFNFIKNYEYIL